MQTVVFNFQSSALSIEEEAIALKAGFILADQPVSAGSTANELFARVSTKNLSLAKKGEIMTKFYSHEKEWSDALAELLRTLKKYALVKHRTKEMLAIQKKTELMLNSCWDHMMTQVEERLNETGFGTFRFLTSERTVGYMPAHDQPETDDGFYFPVSNLFRMKLDASDAASDPVPEESQMLFSLPGEFLSSGYEHPPVFAASDAAAAEPGTCYLHHCFTLPYINKLSLSELQSVRSYLRKPGAAFRSHTDTWAGACYKAEHSRERTDLFLQTVLPHAMELQRIAESNEVLILCHKLYAQYPKTEIWMGELPVYQLWQFYRNGKAIPDESWELMQADKAAFENKRWPVLVLKETKDGIMQEDAGEDVQSTRKYFAVD